MIDIPTAARRVTDRPARAAAAAAVCVALSFALALSSGGCAPKPKHSSSHQGPYQNLGPKKIPAYLKGSVYEMIELANYEPLNISAFGLVGQLRGTGDSKAPPAVREWMTKEMVRRGFGSRTMGFESVPPGRVLASPDFAIVRVDAALPPGARAGDRIDVYVSALANDTSSLANGVLFETELKEDGANPQAPSATIQVWSRCGGPIAVNPAYALDGSANPAPAARASLRKGVVMDNGVVYQDRALWLMLRQPQYSVARAIERRINERFQRYADRPRKDGQPGNVVAMAFDQGIVQFYVPKAFAGDWAHFAGVVTHLYLNPSSGFAATKAAELAQEAVKPDARLLDISYCWEGLGSPAMPVVSKLMAHSDPGVQFAAARAAAFIGDPSFAAQETLIRIAETRDHPFRVTAIQTLGKLPPSTALSQLLRRLLDAPEAVVRIEAYRVLAAAGDQTLFSKSICRYEGREKFVLDVVPSDAPPLIYATRQGRPRIAVFGRMPTVRQPLTFTTLGQRLTIATTKVGEEDKKQDVLGVYYRDPRRQGKESAVKVLSRADVAELAARLGGEGATGQQRLDFSYGEVVAILQALSDKGEIVSSRRGPDGRLLAASFVLQEAPNVQNEINSAPPIDEGRPQGDGPNAHNEIHSAPPIDEGRDEGRPQGDGPNAQNEINSAPPTDEGRPQGDAPSSPVGRLQ